MGKRGVYFVANDRIIDLTIAFLNSFRASNPDIPLCLIPFRNDTQKLAKLSELYHFAIFDDQEFLSFCDQISLLFHPEVTGHYRKLACWQGSFDEFVYIDVDMVVLENIAFSFELLKEYDFVTSCSNIAEAEKWVWKTTIYESNALSIEQIQYAANTGFIVSRKHLIPADTLFERAKEAQKLKMHMELFCKEQPMLNYLMVTSGRKFSSFWLLMDTPLFPQNYIEFWAGNGKKKLVKGNKTFYKGKLRDVFLIHWAGTWQPRPSEIKLFALLNTFRLRRNIWNISIYMPLRKLWKKYRRMNPCYQNHE